MRTTDILNKVDGKKLPLMLFCIAVAVYALISLLIRPTYSDISGAVVLWLLGVIMAYQGVCDDMISRPRLDKSLPWITLSVIIAVTIMTSSFDRWVFFLAYCAIVSYIGGAYRTLRMIPSGIIFLIVLPLQDYLFLLLSFPLSKICTAIAVKFLQIFDRTIHYQNAMIFLGNKNIAITSACSGINLLETMLLLGWMLACISVSNYFLRGVHYLLLIPIIVICNAIRIILLIILYWLIGNAALDLKLHVLFGVLVVLAVTFSMYLAGMWLRKLEQSDED